jgi:hypothetical protein
MVFLVPFWCSIRVAVAFVGFLGMIAHYSQKISVGIALVCMVNHSAIDHHRSSIAMPLTQVDIDCPRANNTVETVNKKLCGICLLKFCLISLIGRSISMDKKHSRYCLRRIFLGLFDY